MWTHCRWNALFPMLRRCPCDGDLALSVLHCRAMNQNLSLFLSFPWNNQSARNEDTRNRNPPLDDKTWDHEISRHTQNVAKKRDVGFFSTKYSDRDPNQTNWKWCILNETIIYDQRTLQINDIHWKWSYLLIFDFYLCDYSYIVCFRKKNDKGILLWSSNLAVFA